MKKVAEMTNDELRQVLLTVDGQGKEFKGKALDELMDRQHKEDLKYDYNLYLNESSVAIFSTNDKDQMWKTLGNIPFGSRYEVRGKNDRCIDEFTPF